MGRHAEGTAVGVGASELFQLLRDGKPRTRAELASLTGYARATVSSRIDELIEVGFIATVADAASTGGRPSSRVAFNPQARVVAAADLGATHATVAITDLSGSVLTEVRESRAISLGPTAVLDWLVETIGILLGDLARQPSDLIGIGIGLPGPVEYSTGTPTNPPIMPGWDGFEVPVYVRRTWNVPVLVDNDVNIMALGEQAMCWPDVQHMIFVKVATGIGAGIISGGRLQHGSDGSAGDIGHIFADRAKSTLCRCGNYGCLEAIAAVPALVRDLAAEGLEVAKGDDIIKLVREGNPAALLAVRQAGRDIGGMLNMCVAVVNPSVIVIGGSLSAAGEHVMAGIREAVYSRSMPLATKNLSIVLSQMGAQAGVVGAGIMAINHALAPQQLEGRGIGAPSS
ncbi:ROK family transcriptional regulator [Arthrobacter subterraneus]|uniref:ROK family transcriptional regulator n=1 Tax=Arthrobacter subterraneus TaxID=335973 RepID=UPI000B8448A0|nr:ROK family transcriptional regulator [Arthrobacter subterraneus]